MEEQLDGCKDIGATIKRAIFRDLLQPLHEHHALVRAVQKCFVNHAK